MTIKAEYIKSKIEPYKEKQIRKLDSRITNKIQSLPPSSWYQISIDSEYTNDVIDAIIKMWNEAGWNISISSGGNYLYLRIP